MGGHGSKASRNLTKSASLDGGANSSTLGPPTTTAPVKSKEKYQRVRKSHKRDEGRTTSDPGLQGPAGPIYATSMPDLTSNLNRGSLPDDAVSKHQSARDPSTIPPTLDYSSAHWANSFAKATRLYPECAVLETANLQSTLSAPQLEAFITILDHLAEQREKTLVAEEGGKVAKQLVSDIVRERDELRQRLRRSDDEIQRLLEENASLQRRAASELHQEVFPPLSDSEQPYLPHADHGFHDDLSQPSSSSPKARLPRLSRIYQPTPLIEAEGLQGSRALVQRTASLKPVLQSSAAEQIALEGGRAQLRSTPEEDSTTTPWAMHSASSRKVYLTVQDLVDRYRDLERDVIGNGKVLRLIQGSLENVSTARTEKFVCAIAMAAYNLSSQKIQQFRETIHELLLSAVKQSDGAVHDVITQQGIQSDRRLSKLAMRTITAEQIPEDLMIQIVLFLQSSSVSCNMDPFVEIVIEKLRQTYPECAATSLVSRPPFHQFLSDVCRLTWQMNLLVPALFLTADNIQFDDRHHMTHLEFNKGAKIDYFLWPTLYSKRYAGAILHKGRVILQSAPNY